MHIYAVQNMKNYIFKICKKCTNMQDISHITKFLLSSSGGYAKGSKKNWTQFGAQLLCCR